MGCTKTNFGVYANGYKSMYKIQKFFLTKGPLFNIFEGPGWRSPPSHPGQSAPVRSKIGIKCFSRFLLVAHRRKPSKLHFQGPIRLRIGNED